MNAKSTDKVAFAQPPVQTPDVIKDLASTAPGGPAHVPTHPPQEEAGEDAGGQLEMPFAFPVKETTQKLSIEFPQRLYEELRIYKKLTDVNMIEVITAGTRAELSRRMKQLGKK